MNSFGKYECYKLLDLALDGEVSNFAFSKINTTEFISEFSFRKYDFSATFIEENDLIKLTEVKSRNGNTKELGNYVFFIKLCIEKQIMINKLFQNQN